LRSIGAGVAPDLLDKTSGLADAAAMDGRARPLPKAERQRLMGSLITRKRIGTQLELMRALGAAGVRVTQATVSRDIRELGLEKTEDALGRPRYVLPAAGGRSTAPREALERVLAEFGRRATPAQNVVVLHSELGSAPAIARALDRVAHPKVVGTLAGDDTVLVIARDAKDARSLAHELGGMVR
jgi:transcriptional regulator of arginine metabolism